MTSLTLPTPKPNPDAMNIDQMLTQEQDVIDQARDRISVLQKQVKEQNNITLTMEEEANKLRTLITEIRLRLEEFQMMCGMFFFESYSFEAAGVKYSQIENMNIFVQTNVMTMGVLTETLDGFITQAIIQKKERLLKEREEQMAKVSVEEAHNDVANMFDDLHEGLKDSLQEIKQNQQDLHEEMLVGDAKLQELGEGIKDNNNVVKEATKTTNAAIEALKKNKDLVFLGAATITFLAGILLIVLL